MGSKATSAHDTLWCCGDLKTASISVGVANLITVIMVTAQYIEHELYTKKFNIEIVAIFLIAMFLLFSSALLLYGTMKKMSWLLLPWMILHLAAVIGSVIFCSIKFHDLGGQRAIPIIGTAIQAYFFILVFGHYVELRKLNLLKHTSAEDQEAKMSEQAKNRCLIDLEVIEEKHDPPNDSSFDKNDTFTDLAFRDSRNPLTSTSQKAFIVPDEIIIPNIQENEEKDVSMTQSREEGQTEQNSDDNVFVGIDDSDSAITTSSAAIPRRTASKSVAHLDRNGSASALLTQPLLPPTRSEPKIIATTVDNNFSPYRSKNAAQNGPKMKIFLPKPASDAGDDTDDESFSSEEEKEDVVGKDVKEGEEEKSKGVEQLNNSLLLPESSKNVTNTELVEQS